MKFKTTEREIKKGYGHIISIPYCGLQYLLEYKNPIAYTSGVYGHNADVYEPSDKWGGVAITMGYRPFGNIEPDYATMAKYEKKARSVLYDKRYKHFETRQRRLNKLIDEFISECISECVKET